MEIQHVRVDSSPHPGRVRSSATVRYETGERPPEEYWIDLPARYAPALSTSGNCWLAFLLPLGVTLGEPLRIPLPVDDALLANALQLMRVWKGWYPSLSVVRLDVQASRELNTAGERTGSFFSGGVDSFFSLLLERDTAKPGHRWPIQDLVTVHGFDIPLYKRTEFDRLRARHERIAEAAGLELLDVATNLRETRWTTADWSTLAHGAGLTGIALALENRFATVYIPGSGAYRGDGLHPWGSHVVTDPLFSTRHLTIAHEAVEYLRTERIRAIAESPLAQAGLRVCWALDSDENCGVCSKCLRTMLVLDLCGALSSFRTFPSVPLLERIAKMECTVFDLREIEDIRIFAMSRGRLDAVRAIDRTVARTKRRHRLRSGFGWAARWFK